MKAIMLQKNLFISPSEGNDKYVKVRRKKPYALFDITILAYYNLFLSVLLLIGRFNLFCATSLKIAIFCGRK